MVGGREVADKLLTPHYGCPPRSIAGSNLSNPKLQSGY